MASRTRRAALAFALAIVALGPVAATAPTSSASPAMGSPGACTDSTGITVVVDASAFGKGVQVRCAPQPVRTGLEALSRAGFTFSGTTQFPGLLCRIDDEPASDPCQGAPPADAYWAYWHAPRGGSWSYSTSGAGSRVPPPGSVEGWAFGQKDQPGVGPPDPLPSPPTTTASRPSSSAASGGEVTTTNGPTDGAAAAATSGAGLEASPSTTEGLDDSTTTSRRDLGAGGSEGPAGDAEEAAAVTRRPEDDGSGGSPTGAVVGLIAVAALAIAGIRLARRRASEEELA